LIDKDWIIVVLLTLVIFLVFYLFVYPYLIEKSLNDARKIIIQLIRNQLENFGEVRITIDGKQYILVEKSRCEEIVKKEI